MVQKVVSKKRCFAAKGGGGGRGVRRVGWTRRVFMPSPQSPPPPPQLPGGEERTSVRHRSGRRRVVAPNWRVTKKISHDNNKSPKHLFCFEYDT